MRSVEEGSIVSCEISYFPIDSKEYLKEINRVLELIKETALEYNIGALSTTIIGDSKKVFDLINNIHKEMSSKDCNYTMNIMISNTCGCDI